MARAVLRKLADVYTGAQLFRWRTCDGVLPHRGL